VALTKIITDVIDDSIRIGSGSLATISGSSASTGSFGRVIVAEMGNSDLTSVSSSISTRITTNSGSFAAASSSYSSASGSLSTRVNLLEGSGSINDLVTDSGSFSTRVNLLEGSGSIFESSASFSTRVNLLEGSGSINDLVTDSGSFSTRVNLLEGSGSITESSASFSTRVSDLKTDSGSFSTRVSDLKTDSGSFSTRVSDLVTDSGSFSTRVATAEASGALFDGDGEVTFAGATITGTLTAQEVHTEFISASVTVSTGSNIFGDETGDVHQFTGSIETSGSIILDTLGGNVSGSIVSTGSFGAANVAGMTVSNLVDVSSSISTRVSDLVTDSGSFSTRVSDLVTDSGSFSTRVSDLVTDSGSFSTRVSDLNLSLSGSTTLISGSAVSTGSFGSVHTAGRVGIGTTAPADILDISQTGNEVQVRLASNSNNTRGFIYANNNNQIGFKDSDGDSVYQTGDNESHIWSTQGSETMRLTAAGRLGIGTDSPDGDLDVRSDVGYVYLTSGLASGVQNLVFRSGSASIAGAGGTGTSEVWIAQMEFAPTGTSQIVTRTASSLALGVNNSQKLMISGSSGFVGIGTTAPDSELHVAAAGSPSIRVTDTTNTITGKFQSDNSVSKIGTHTNHPFILLANNTEVMRVLGSGLVGINCVPTDELTIDSASDPAIVIKRSSASSQINKILTDSSGLYFQSAGHATGANNQIGFQVTGSNSDTTAGINAMRITAAGRVGVGTTEPASFFHVAGDPGNDNTLVTMQNTHASVDGDDTILRMLFSGDAEASGGHFIEFRDGNTDDNLAGTIECASGTATNNTISDYRLKENISLITGSLSTVNALKPSYFNYKRYPNKVHQGFVAHEVVEAGIGYAVTGNKDAVKPNGNIKIQEFAITNLIPQMVSAIQELTQAHRDLRAQITGSTDINQLKALVSGSTFV